MYDTIAFVHGVLIMKGKEMFQYHYGVISQFVDKRFSFATIEPNKKELLDFVYSEITGQNSSYNLPLGLAITNPKDHFVRKVGRDLAIKRIQKYECKLLCLLKVDATTSNISLIAKYNEEYNITITFRISSKSDRIRIENVVVYETIESIRKRSV
jgi:hypothetical protein